MTIAKQQMTIWLMSKVITKGDKLSVCLVVWRSGSKLSLKRVNVRILTAEHIGNHPCEPELSCIINKLIL